MSAASMLMAGGLAAATLSSTFGCDAAEIVDCSPGTYLRNADGAEYCVYTPDEIPRDVLGRPRCPADVPVLTEFPGGLVCSRSEIAPGALPQSIEEALAVNRAATPPPGTSECLAGRVIVAAGPSGSVPELIGTRAGGFAVAWAGAVRELSADGMVLGSSDVPLDRGLGYGLAELSDGLAVAWADESYVVTARVGADPSGGTYPFPASGPSLGVDAEGRMVVAYVEQTDALGFEVVSYRLAPSSLDPIELALPRWFVSTPLRPAVAQSPSFAVAAGAALDWATSVNANEVVHSFPRAVSSVDVDAQLDGARTAVVAGRTVYWTTPGTDDVEIGTIAVDGGRVSLAQIPGTSSFVVAFGADGSAALRRIDDDVVVGPPTFVAAEGLHDVAVASNARGVGVVWAERAESGSDELVFARYACD